MYGVAKTINLIAVKVLGSIGSCTMADAAGGVLWAIEQVAKKLAVATGKTRHKGSVTKMSLGGGMSQVLNDAINEAIEPGIHFPVAAGDDNRNVYSYSPTSTAKAATIGTSALGNDKMYFSNHGRCADVFAPGERLDSAW
jgi:cerevisin